MQRNLILASSSAYRKQLLARLQLPFTTQSPAIDESGKPNEPANELVQRLAHEKAKAVAIQHNDALIIGSDQVAVLGKEILKKPGTKANAITQLKKCAGNTVTFHTGLCLYDSNNKQMQLACVDYKVRFRDLSIDQIERYVDQEQPFDSAGSFKAEALGISLFEYMQGDDPTALIGLPLIALTSMLHNAGVELP